MKLTEKLYHVTVLSNFARGFDKYSRAYSKARIPESTFPDRFFLLRKHELGIGIQKATRLMERLSLEGNHLIALETETDASLLFPNTTTGRGHFIRSNQIQLHGFHRIDLDENGNPRLSSLTVEDAMAASLRLLNPELIPFTDIRPRAISFLPVAQACQAKCPFCFSKASVSGHQAPAKPDWERISGWLDRARVQGAERAVITGGGEPTLLSPAALVQLVAACAQRFSKVVLITNGHAFATLPEIGLIGRLEGLYSAGLRVLAISRHHFDAEQNESLMHLRTPVESLTRVWRENQDRWPELRLRFISVLQAGGVKDDSTMENYLSWTANQGVREICFKELYVSTSRESVYHDHAANAWSRQHQVPLSLVTRFAASHGFTVESQLPWGAPVYKGTWQGLPLRVAAYTEPSLFWERAEGIARSWNVMADGRCHVSLEDRASEIKLEEMV